MNNYSCLLTHSVHVTYKPGGQLDVYVYVVRTSQSINHRPLSIPSNPSNPFVPIPQEGNSSEMTEFARPSLSSSQLLSYFHKQAPRNVSTSTCQIQTDKTGGIATTIARFSPSSVFRIVNFDYCERQVLLL